MDVIILCHTEFGFVNKKEIIYNKKATSGVTKGVHNLIKIADNYDAKITFAVMPEVVSFFPKELIHEIGLHIHPGWAEIPSRTGPTHIIGDSFLKEHCHLNKNSTVLKDYSYKDQLDLIKKGKDCLEKKLEIKPTSFVAGRWSINNDTVRSLIKTGFTHDCSALANSIEKHYDWSKLPRICMPYHPSKTDYQKNGNLPLLIIPTSQTLSMGNVSPENSYMSGISWLKACFLEYYKQKLPLFHICLHSPCMTDSYYISKLDSLLKYISRYKINFKYASEIKAYNKVSAKTKFLPYMTAFNRHIAKSLLSKLSGGL